MTRILLCLILLPLFLSAELTYQDALKTHIQIDPEKNTIGHIKIDDRVNGIGPGTWIYVKKALDYYKETKPDFIILELNTPGGEVVTAQQISDALKEIDTQYDIPVVTFINNWAISAGAMLAYSTRFITVVKDGTMGAAEPVIAGEAGSLITASEKINSAIRADFASRAQFFDRNPLIAEAMVDKDMILVLRDGKILRLNKEEEVQGTDKLITPKGKLLTLSAPELIEYGVADQIILPEKVPVITDEELEAGKWPAEKMALFHTPFFDAIPNATIDSYRVDWRTKFFMFLGTPSVSSLLFLGMMLGLYMEFNTPGFGVAGTIGVTCLFLIILSSFALEIGSMLELIFLLAGLAMIGVEIFLIPGFGLFGVIGTLFFLGGLTMLTVPNMGPISYDNAAGQALLERLGWIGGTFLLGLMLMLLLSRFVIPAVAGRSKLILEGGEQEGFYADSLEMPESGDRGVVSAPLRTSGKVIINGTIYDATSEGDFIESGASVIVTRVNGSNIFVAKLGE